MGPIGSSDEDYDDEDDGDGDGAAAASAGGSPRTIGICPAAAAGWLLAVAELGMQDLDC